MRFLIIFFLFCGPVFADDVIFYNESNQLISYSSSIEPSRFAGCTNCKLYDSDVATIRALVASHPLKYLKYANGEVVVMSQAEKDAVNAAEATATTTSNRTYAKDYFTNREMKVLLEVIVDEFNRNRTWDGKPAITRQDVINAINAKVDAGEVD